MKKLGYKRLLFVVALLAVVIFFVYQSKNIAENEFSSIYSSVVDRGAWTKICKNGDSGKGIDNDRPWAGYVYKTSASEGLKQQILDAAGQKGYNLVNDNESVAAVGGLEGYKNSVYLKDENNKNNHTIRIASAGDVVSPDCTIDGKYMPELVVQPGENLIHIRFSFPAR